MNTKKEKTISRFIIKSILCTVCVVLVIALSDYKGYFNPNTANDHVQWKWDSYHQLAKDNDIDIVLIGNSHLFTGINPKNLSAALGATNFILAAPGTQIIDSYFTLKEAIAIKKPKLVVIETYGISNTSVRKASAGEVSLHLQSFHTRKNILQKLVSMPYLFSADNYPAAWSNTIRNHSFIFNDTAQIKSNIAAAKKKQYGKMDGKLYLGRFMRFQTGLEDSTLAKYAKGPILDCNEFKISKEAEKYIQKIVDLCKQNDIAYMFLTIPSYYRHFQNYEAQHNYLARIIGQDTARWLDMQLPYDYNAFTPDCFENTLEPSQHLTYNGSLVASYKLARYINEQFRGLLPNRSTDIAWKKLFYGEEGYFENYSPEPGDKKT